MTDCFPEVVMPEEQPQEPLPLTDEVIPAQSGEMDIEEREEISYDEE